MNLSSYLGRVLSILVLSTFNKTSELLNRSRDLHVLFFPLFLQCYTRGTKATATEAVAALGGETSFLTTSSPPPQLSLATPAAAKPNAEGKVDELAEKKVDHLLNSTNIIAE